MKRRSFIAMLLAGVGFSFKRKEEPKPVDLSGWEFHEDPNPLRMTLEECGGHCYVVKHVYKPINPDAVAAIAYRNA